MKKILLLLSVLAAVTLAYAAPPTSGPATLRSENSDVNIETGTTGNINLATNGTRHWQIDGTTGNMSATGSETLSCKLTPSTNLIYSTSIFEVAANTADGADSSRLQMTGGGSAAISRGANLYLYGNENGGSTNGNYYLRTGNVAASGGEGYISARTNLYFQANNGGYQTLWTLDTTTGNLTSDGTNGGEFSIGKAGTGITFKAGGAAARSGTFTCNGVTGVVVSTTAASTLMAIAFSPQTISGTAPIGSPYVSAISAGTSFTVKCSVAGETSLYNWVMFKTN